MITQQTAFEYAEALQEFVSQGGCIELICACQDTKQVVRKSYNLIRNYPTPVTIDQVDASIASLEFQKAKLQEEKALVELEEEKVETMKQGEGE